MSRGSPDCNRQPDSAEKMGELAQCAAELRARLLPHSPQPLTREHLPKARTTVADKLGLAVSETVCLNAVIVSLLDAKAILTTEEVATLATIGANVAMRDLRGFLTPWMGGDQS